jgi:hypothetical protein
MAQSTILASGTTAANSSDVVVTTTPVSISISDADGGGLPSQVQLALTRKIGSLYQPVFDNYRGNYGPVYLGADRMDVAIFAPGTYRVERPVVAVAIVVTLDTTA